MEFYSLLFLPFTKTWGPLDPTQPELEILPWSGKVSWDNFWKVFGSFDIDTNNLKTRKWYKRSTWRIFKNVVENLRVKASARSLAAKWRAMAADKRSEVIMLAGIGLQSPMKSLTMKMTNLMNRMILLSSQNCYGLNMELI